MQQKSENSNEEGFYEVERVTAHRVALKGKRNVLELEVKWKGYEETTWESFAEFARDSPELVQKYFLKREKEIGKVS